MRLHVLASALVLLTCGPAAWAQGADPAGAADPAAAAVEPPPPPPTIDEAVGYLNEILENNPSPWRPCRATSQVELSEDGYLSVITERSSYCEDTRMQVHVRDLDPATAEVLVEDLGQVLLQCVGGGECVRHFQKRKIREDGAWVLRDDDWIARGPAAQPHRVGAVSIPVASDARVLTLVSSSVAYVLRSASQDPAYAPPADPFAGKVAVVAAEGGEAPPAE